MYCNFCSLLQLGSLFQCKCSDQWYRLSAHCVDCHYSTATVTHTHYATAFNKLFIVEVYTFVQTILQYEQYDLLLQS